MRMLEVFVLKFKAIADIQLPMLVNKWYDPTPALPMTFNEQVSAANL